MKPLSVTAKLYILGMIAAGAEAFAWFAQRWSLQPQQVWLTAALAAAASVAQVLKVEGATRKSSYNLSLVAYALAFVLLGPAAAAAVVVVACVADWLVHRYPWYIQSFNIGALLVALLGAGAASEVAPALLSGEIAGMTRLVSFTAVFVLLNHLFVGIVIYLARHESFRESGVFDAMTLGMDASLVGLGALAAYVWEVNPWASLMVAPPLALLYFSLRVPMLQRQAVTDPKTGLYNARYFNDALKRELDRCERFERPVTVVMADLDLLRNINNKYGHVAGDIVLKGIADLLCASVRDYDIVARFGGEEFAILMSETTMRDAEAKLETIRLDVEQAEFQVPTSVDPIQVTMSFGVAEHCAGETVLDIIHHADLALYQAKRDGRNRVRVARRHAKAAIGAVPAGVPEACAAPAVVAAAALTPPVYTSAVTEPEPASPTMSDQPPQPMWMSETLIVVVALAAAGILLTSLGTAHALGIYEWLAVAAFSALVFGAEMLSVDIQVRESSVSTSVVPFVAGALLFGPSAVAVMAVASAFGAFIKHHSQASRFVFNVSTQLIAGLVALGAVRMAVPISGGNTYTLLLGTAVAFTAVYLVTTVLVSLAIALTAGERPLEVWTTRFRWLGPHYLALSFISAAAVLGYRQAGTLGALMLMSPMLILRFGQEQYVEHTKEMVTRLRTTNTELELRTERIENLNQELLLALTNMVELRDPYMLGHSQYVAGYATAIAERMGLPADVRDRVETAGLLHDIGKLGVPEAVLLKEGILDAPEREVVQRHCAIGGDIVTQCSSLRPIVKAVRHHHERYDGLGYPDHLSGEQIPIEARILAVADSVEAMASDRPYRHAMAPDEIIDEVARNAGSQFDPAVARVFCEIVRERGSNMIVNSALKVAQAAAEACDPSRLVAPQVVASVIGVDRAC